MRSFPFAVLLVCTLGTGGIIGDEIGQGIRKANLRASGGDLCDSLIASTKPWVEANTAQMQRERFAAQILCGNVEPAPTKFHRRT